MKINKLNISVKFFALILCLGVLSGLASSIFLHSLNYVTQLRLQNNFLVYFLPIGGIVSSFLYFTFGKNSSKGGKLIMEEIHQPKNKIPLRMAPLVFLGTMITHLFGGSAGREGTAVQISSSLADFLSHQFHLNSKERRKFLIIGISAGFGSVLSAPWAGMIFGSEVVTSGKIEKDSLIESGIASFIAYFITRLLHAPHTSFQAVLLSKNYLLLIFLAIGSGILFGLIARIFLELMHFIEAQVEKISLHTVLKTFLGGVIIVVLYQVLGGLKYSGLGLESIQNSFSVPASLLDVFGKMFFTVITLASGFIGGEFVPLVFMGSHTGSFLGSFFMSDLTFLTALGFCAVFAGASKAPLTCSIMACEIFGWSLFPFSLLACYMSFFFSGNKGIYKISSSKKMHH